MKSRPSLAIAVTVGVLIVALIGSVGAARAILGAPDNAQGQARILAATSARALDQAIGADAQLAVAIASEAGVDQLVQRTASQPTAAGLAFADLNVQRANPQLTGIFFFNSSGTYVLGHVVNRDPAAATHLGVSCDATATYCVDTNAPTSGYLASGTLRAHLVQVLTATAAGSQDLAFDRGGGAFGLLYLLRPVHAGGSGRVVGAVVARIEAESLFAPYVHGSDTHTLLMAGTVVIDAALPSYRARHQLPVSHIDPHLDRGTTGGLAQTLAPLRYDGANGRFALHGNAYAATMAAIPGTSLGVVGYLPYATPAGANTLLIGAIALFFIACFANLVLLFLPLPAAAVRPRTNRLLIRGRLAQRYRSMVLNGAILVAVCLASVLALTIDTSNYMRSAELMAVCVAIVFMAWVVAR